MPRKAPPPHPRGAPRTPGSGRRKGTENRKTVELRMLMGAMAGDIDYQRKLSQDFRKRRLHPSTEIRIWEYAVGRPKEQLELSANVTMNERMEAERKLLQRLDLRELEQLAAESQALLDRAVAVAQERLGIRASITVVAPQPIARAIGTESGTATAESSDTVVRPASGPRAEGEGAKLDDAGPRQPR